MAGTNNRFKRNAESTGVEPKTLKNEVPEEKIEETVEPKVATEKEAKEVTASPAAPQPAAEPTPAPVAPTPQPAISQDANMTMVLDGMIDFEHRFKKREPKNKQIPLNITPTVQEQLQFLVDNNMIKSRNDFIFQLVEGALNNIFANPEIRDAFNKTREWEK